MGILAESFASGSAGDPALPASEPLPTGMLLSRDLIFTTKIVGTAAELGYRVLAADSQERVKSLIESHRPRLVFVDLTAGDLVAPAALSAYLRSSGPGTQFVAFGPHVDGRALAEARAAGCQVVLPRSKFAADLPELIRHYFSAPMIQSTKEGP